MTLKLDENQQKAIEHFQGPALVVAGPGSGKTTVIKERILYLIREHNVDPEQILAIAFTNAAVTELEERILGELNSNHGHPKIRTLHGFGKDIITDNYRQAGFSFPPAVWGGKIKPILEQEREQLERNASDAIVAIYKIQSQTTGKCYIGQSINPTHRKKQHFRNSSNSRLRQAIRNEGSSQFTFEIIERVRGIEANERESYWMEHYRNSGGVFNSTNPLRQQYSNQLLIELFCQFFNARDTEEFNKILQEVMTEKSKVETGLFVSSTINDNRVRTFAEKYEAARQKTDAVDFQDMLIYSAHLLESCPSLCQYYCDKYSYVLIDEFQDISRADFRLIKLLSENIFAVGDDDQAIYGFRGGDSKIMLEFADQQNVSKYEITRNYRSTSTIVAHARALIEKNISRIPKDLRPQNPMQREIKIIESTLGTVETSLLSELRLPEEIAILTRTNYEIEKIEEILDNQSFPIEVSTIHKAKGKEWEKVILIVNALDVWDNGSPYISLPDTRNEVTEERRVFYVAMTRAKQELIVLGGNCQFISEFQNLSSIEIAKLQRLETKNELKETLNEVLASLERKLRRELEEEIEAALIQFRQEVRQKIKAARTQYEPELRHLRHTAIKAEHAKQNEQKQIDYVLPQKRKTANDAFLKGLIPVLDRFESQITNLPATVESNNESADFVEFTKSIRLAEEQLLGSLKNHGLKPIKTVGELFNPDRHEEILPAIYSDEVQAGWVAREERRGYLLHNQVIRKAQVVISKGENIRAPERLDQVVDIYLHRLISAFQTKYELINIDQHLVKLEMVKYLLELDDASIHEIVSFSSKSKAEVIQLKRYADYCAGLEKIHRCTEIFRGFWNKIWMVIKSLYEDIKQADTFLSQDFAQPVRFVTYAGILDLSEIETFKDGIKGFNPRGEERQLLKLDVLFAFPRDDMETLKSRIKRKPTIGNQKLQPIELISERFHIADDTLKSLLIKRDTVESSNREDPTVRLVTRSGHVLNGHLWDFDTDYLYMDINKRNVIVYRAGILQFRNLIWSEITKAYKNGMPINGYISKQIKNGLQVQFGALHGFLPKSQVELNTVRNLDSYVGKTFKMKVTKLSKTNNNIVFSRRAWLEERRTKLLNTLEEGQHVTGVVKNITSFGAFVDLDGIDGLLHISEITWKRINHPSEVVSVGEEVEVQVIDFDRENEKISLSLKQVRSDPWENVENKYPIGSKARGVVVNIVDYGAFVQLEEGIVGLIHASEMPLVLNNMLLLDILSKGDELEVTVLKIFKDSQRISLSIK